MKYALVTGAKGGLASAAIEELLAHDFTVFAADIDYCQTSQKNRLIEMHLDVTDVQSVRRLIDEILTFTHSLDLVVNLAGIVAIGSLVEGADIMAKVLAVNVGGMYLVNKYAFPLIKKAGGRIINVSSEYGVIDGVPFHGFYTASKHAVEAYNDSLRRELNFQGIKVVAIRPGAFATPMQAGIAQRFVHLVNETQYYRKPLLKMKKFMDAELAKAKSPLYFVSTFCKACFAPRPRRYYKVGNSMKMKLLTALPPRLQDALYKSFLK